MFDKANCQFSHGHCHDFVYRTDFRYTAEIRLVMNERLVAVYTLKGKCHCFSNLWSKIVSYTYLKGIFYLCKKDKETGKVRSLVSFGCRSNQN